jgi:hypothetical protein
MPFDLTDPDQLALRASAYELAFAEAGHALDAQEQTLRDLIARAGMLMAAAAVITSVFGGQVIAHDGVGSAVIAAFVAFSVVGLVVANVLWPRADWEFETWAIDLLTEYIEPADVPLAMIHRDLAIHRAASARRNLGRLRRTSRSLQFGMGALVIEVVAWVVAVSTVI